MEQRLQNFDSLVQQCRIVIGEGAVVGIVVVSLVVLGPVSFLVVSIGVVPF